MCHGLGGQPSDIHTFIRLLGIVKFQCADLSDKSSADKKRLL